MSHKYVLTVSKVHSIGIGYKWVLGHAPPDTHDGLSPSFFRRLWTEGNKNQ